jgi:predicted transcriptional regulator
MFSECIGTTDYMGVVMSPAKQQPSKTKSKRPSRTKKQIHEVVAYAIRHGTRVQLLILLNERAATTAELAELVGESKMYVGNHLRELLESGAIEIAKTEMMRNRPCHWYRAVEFPDYSDEEFAALAPKEQDMILGLAFQSTFAEAMGALAMGTMRRDPDVWVVSGWPSVDRQGRREIKDELEQSWDRLQEIAGAAANRCANSGEKTTSVFISQMAFRRARKGQRFPTSSGTPE